MLTRKRIRLQSENAEVEEEKGMEFYRNIYYRYVSPTGRVSGENIFAQTDEFIVLIYNQPKSSLHLLLLPKQTFLNVKSCRELSPTNLEKIQRLHSAAAIIVDHLISESTLANSLLEVNCSVLEEKLSVPTFTNTESLKNSPRIKMGYHALPSFEPLHIHILTDDFNSTWLKTRRQWNTFNSAFFLDCSSIEEWLSSNYNIEDLLPDNEELEIYLRNPIKCLHCQSAMKDIRTLKAHLAAEHRNIS